MPPWAAGDEVYGRSGQLRTFLDDNQIGYVMRVGCAFHIAVAPSSGSARADQMVTRYVGTDAWQVCSVTGSKGERAYACLDRGHQPTPLSADPQHLRTGDLAYHYCFVPEGRPVTLMTLVRVACLRWPVEEGFEFGKDHFGLDHSQVRLYTALSRHIVLTSPRWLSVRSPPPRPEPAHPPRFCPPHPMSGRRMIQG
jgi:hypothetical protein